MPRFLSGITEDRRKTLRRRPERIVLFFDRALANVGTRNEIWRDAVPGGGFLLRDLLEGFPSLGPIHGVKISRGDLIPAVGGKQGIGVRRPRRRNRRGLSRAIRKHLVLGGYPIASALAVETPNGDTVFERILSGVKCVIEAIPKIVIRSRLLVGFVSVDVRDSARPRDSTPGLLPRIRSVPAV